MEGFGRTIGALIITYTILGVPYYNYKYSIPVVTMKAPILCLRESGSGFEGVVFSVNGLPSLEAFIPQVAP